MTETILTPSGVKKVYGLKSAAGDINRCRSGYHVQVWSHADADGNISLYTSEAPILTVWTSGVPEGDKRIEYEEYARSRWSTSRKLRAAVRNAYGGQ